MPIKSRKVTPRMAGANRKNAKKSTGPRTPRGKKQVAYNALRHGLYAKPSLDFMLAAGEDPKELRQILAGLRESFHPFTPAQDMLVEDLAMLRWQNRRIQRGQAATISEAQNTLDTNIEEQCMERDRPESGMSFDQAEVEEKGLINMPECPGKFKQILETLQELLDRVEGQELDIDSSSALLLLYGKKPSLRGNFLCNRFGEARQKELDECRYLKLKMTVMDELIDWNQKYQTYMRRYMEVTPARHDLCFAPKAEVWKLMLRREESLDRQMERKTRLLWAMQKEDWQRKEDPQWQEIVPQATERGQNQARDEDATFSRKVEGVVAKIIEQHYKMEEQSRQGAEKKGRLRRHPVRRRKNRGGKHRGTPRGRPSEDLVGARPRPDQAASAAVAGVGERYLNLELANLTAADLMGS